MKKGGWLFWKDKYLSIIDENGNILYRFNDEVSLEKIEEINFVVDKYWIIKIPSVMDQLYISNNGISWYKIPILPEKTTQKLTLGFHPEVGKVTLMKESSHVWIASYNNTWKKVAIPKNTSWIGFDKQSIMWVTGSKHLQLGKKDTTQVVVWYQKNNREWIEFPIKTSFWDIYQTIYQGGFEEFNAINVFNKPKIFNSESNWFDRETYSFIFTEQNNGKIKIQRLKNYILQRIIRQQNQKPLIICSKGEILYYQKKQWRPLGIEESIKKIGFNTNYKAILSVQEKTIFGVIKESYKNDNKKTGIKSYDMGKTWKILNTEDIKEQKIIAPWTIYEQ